MYCDKFQVLCFLFSEVIYAKGVYLSYFNHVKEVFKSSWRLLLRV